MRAFHRFILTAVALLPLFSCTGGSSAAGSGAAGTDIAMSHARLLKMTRQDDGIIKASITNPWDTTITLATYLLVPEGVDMPGGISGVTAVRVPLKHALIYSGVHAALVAESGKPQAVAGMCDTGYIADSALNARIKAGEIADCGSSDSPDIERIVMLAPDAILLSPYSNGGGIGRLSSLGIPVIQCADYMEPTPLARAEWMRFFGILFGVGERADSLFETTEREYISLRDTLSGISRRPGVILDYPYGGMWSVPGARSATSILIRDAGGRNPFDDRDIQGSITLAPEEVFATASDADFWFVRYAGTPSTVSELTSIHPLMPRFKAATGGNVYGVNTITSTYFEEMPFHPQWQLADMASILHPELGLKPTHRYFHPLP